MKINDGHWHISRQYPIQETDKYIKEEMDYLNIEKIAILSLEQDSNSEVEHTANIKALYLRDKGEGRRYAFASLH